MTKKELEEDNLKLRDKYQEIYRVYTELYNHYNDVVMAEGVVLTDRQKEFVRK